MSHLLQALTLFQLYQGDFNGSLHYTINTSYLYPLEKNIEQFDLSIDLNFSQRIDLIIGLHRNYSIQASESSITISRKLIQQQIIEFDFNGPQCKYQFQGYLSKSNLRSLKISSFEIGILDQSASLEYLLEKPKIGGFYRLQIEIILGSGIMGFQKCYSEGNDCIVNYELMNRQKKFIDFEYNLEECYFDACKLMAGFKADQLSQFRLSLFNVNKTILHRIIIYRNQDIHQENKTNYSIFAEAGTTLTLFLMKWSGFISSNGNSTSVLNTIILPVIYTDYIHFELEQSDLSFKAELLNADLALIPSILFQDLPKVMLKDENLIIERNLFMKNHTNLDKLISQINGIKLTVVISQDLLELTFRFYLNEIPDFKYFNQSIQIVKNQFQNNSKFNIMMKAELYIDDMALPYITNDTVQLTNFDLNQQPLNNQTNIKEQQQPLNEHEGLKNIFIYAGMALVLLGFILYLTNKHINKNYIIKQEDEEMHSINGEQ